MNAFKLFLLIVFVKIACSLPVESEWGSKQGQWSYETKEIELLNEFRIREKNFTKFFASFNGAIYTNSTFQNSNDNESSNWHIFPNCSIFGYFADIWFPQNCTNGCGMFVNNKPSNEVLQSINSLVGRNFSANANTTFIVTWNKALSYNAEAYANESLENTFQVILTSNGDQSYVIFGYDKINYLVGNGSMSPKVGYYVDASYRCEVALFGDSVALNQLKCQSNINRKGVYVAGLTTSSNYQCFWDRGFNRLIATCSDCLESVLVQCSNLCQINNGGCEDICNGVEGGVKCSCSYGYLKADNASCFNDQSFYYATMFNSVEEWRDNENYHKNLSGFDENNIVAMDHDFDKNLLYFSENSKEISKIGAMNINGGNKRLLYTVVGFVDVMAFDWIRNYLFYSLKTEGIYFLNMEMEFELAPVLVVSNPTNVQPRAMLFENCARSLYVAFYGENGYIARIGMSNYSLNVIVQNLKYPSALAIDRIGKKLYWADAMPEKIECSNFDGSCRQFIAFITSYYPWSMFYFNKTLFWGSNNGYISSIMRTSISTKVTTWYKEAKSTPFKIGMFKSEMGVQCDSNYICDVDPIPTFNISFVPFGLPLDSLLSSSDDGGDDISLSSFIPFAWDYTRTKNMFIGVNGYITFTSVIGSSSTLNVFSADLDTRLYGNIFYRESIDPNLIQTVSLEVEKTYRNDFLASHLVIVTWNLVPRYSNSYLLHTFQAIIASNNKESYAILYYKRLDSSGSVGTSSCSFLTLPYSSNDLVQLGVVVLKLTTCFQTTISPPIISTVQSTTNQPSTTYTITTSSPTIDNGVISLSKISSIGSLFQASYVNYDIKNSITSFCRVVSGEYPSNSFAYYMSSYWVIVATFVANSNYAPTNDLLLMSVESSSQNLTEVQLGKFEATAYLHKNCLYKFFEKNMSNSPVVTLSAYSPAVDQYQHLFPLLWLYNVTTDGFGVCYEEQFSFSGLKSIWIHFMAVAKSFGNITEASTLNFSEVTNNTKYHRCEKLYFVYKYSKIPMVFVTPEVVTSNTSIFINDSDLNIANTIAWVHSINNSYATICTKSSPYRNKNPFSIKVHYLVAGNKDACLTFHCEKGMECKLDYNSKPYCVCVQSCPLNDAVCGSDFKNYRSECEMQMYYCLRNVNSSSWPVVAYKGSCKGYPYLTGRVKIDPVDIYQNAFSAVICKYVPLNEKVFYKYNPLQVILSASRNSPFNHSQSDASVVWSKNVSISGFDACILTTGRKFFENVNDLTVHWVAFQESWLMPEYMEGGIVEMPVWYSGSICVTISLSHYISADQNIFLSVSHSNLNDFADTVTVWLEGITWNTNAKRVCMRELQNFVGRHEGIKVHWLAIYKPVPMLTPETGQIGFSTYNDFQSSDSSCKIVSFNSNYPMLLNPTVVITGVLYIPGSYFPSIYSNYDISAWIESSNYTHLRVCSKYLSAEINALSFIISYAVFPRLCDDGFYFHANQCYALLDKEYTYEFAQLQCSSLNASLPTIVEQSDDFFLDSFDLSAVWLGLQKDNQNGNWYWNNNDSSFYRNWGKDKPDGGMLENCTASIGQLGWDDRSCSETHSVVCSKDPSYSKQECLLKCQNGACIMNGSLSCSCNTGFYGKWCEFKLAQSECYNYVMLNEPWRKYVIGSKPVSPLYATCDKDLVQVPSLWVRFSATSTGKMVENTCVSSNHCGVKFPGWLASNHPLPEDGVVNRTLYFYSSYCGRDTGVVRIKNCYDYYVYNFVSMPWWSCDFGVCIE